MSMIAQGGILLSPEVGIDGQAGVSRAVNGASKDTSIGQNIAALLISSNSRKLFSRTIATIATRNTTADALEQMDECRDVCGRLNGGWAHCRFASGRK